MAQSLEKLHPKLITAEYRIAKRPEGRVLVDYNQNAWGRTLASVYSVRPKPRAPVSAPITGRRSERGIEIEDFRLDNVPRRLKKTGDLWKPLLQSKGILTSRSFYEPADSPSDSTMDALLVKEMPTGSGWQYEPKWDGFRCLVYRDGEGVFLQSKSGQPLTRYFPELVELFLKFKAKRFVLDGESPYPSTNVFRSMISCSEFTRQKVACVNSRRNIRRYSLRSICWWERTEKTY